MRHLAHFGVVTEAERERRFASRAPFSERIRAYTADLRQMAGYWKEAVREFPSARGWSLFSVAITPATNLFEQCLWPKVINRSFSHDAGPVG